MTAAAFTVPGTLQTGDPLTVTWTVENLGAGATAATVWYDRVVLSADDTLTDDDPVVGSWQRTNPLAPGESYTTTRSYALPAGLVGTFAVFIRTDADDQVPEDADGNNTRRAVGTVEGGGPTGTVGVADRPTPDLRVTAVDAPAVAAAGQGFAVTWTTRNAGPGAAGGGWYDAVYLSLDQNFDAEDRYLGYRDRPQALAAGEAYTQTATFRIPPGVAGPYYVFVRADGGNHVAEAAEANNAGYDPSALRVTLLPPADLVVGTITLPVNGVPGRTVAVTYTVENRGVNAAQGDWTDSLYLSADGTWDVTDALVGRVAVSADVAGGGSYTRTLTAPLPGVLPGEYRVIVRSDITNRLPESDEGNNLAASLDRVALDAEALTLGTPAAGAVGAGQSAYYRVDLPAGETARFTLDGAAAAAGTEVYVRYGAVPTRTSFDFAANEPFRPDQALTIPADRAGAYYVLVYRAALSGSPDYTLRADLVPFSLSGVSAAAGGDSGEFTVRIDGARFSPDTTFELVAAGGAAYPADRTVVRDTTTAYATFDLTFAGVGAYTLRATRGAATVTLAAPFQLQASTGAGVVTDVEAASDLRPNRSYTLQLFYANQGNQDSAAPLLLVESLTGTSLGLSRDSQVAGAPLQILGVGPDGPYEVLRPGARGSVQVSYATGSAALGLNLRVRHVLATDTRVLSDADWAQVEASVRPAGVADGAWDAYWARIRPRIGTTWGDYVGFLNRLVVKVGSPGQANHDVKGLIAELFATDPTYKPSSHFTGSLLNAQTGAPVARVGVEAYRDVDGVRERFGVATTDAAGKFTIPFLQSGTYSLSLGPRRFDMDRNGLDDFSLPTFTTSAGADAAGTFYALAQPDSDAGRSLAITIRDANSGTVLDAATVVVFGPGGTTHVAAPTNDRRFSLNGLESGTYTISVDAPAHARTLSAVTISDADVVLDVPVGPESTLTGRVRLNGSIPVGPFLVIATRTDVEVNNRFYFEGSGGAFAVGGLPAGVFDLSVLLLGSGEQIANIAVGTGESIALGTISVSTTAGPAGDPRLTPSSLLLEAELAAAESYLVTTFLPAITSRFGFQVGGLWSDFIFSSPSSPRSGTFTDGDAVVEGNFFENGFRQDAQVNAFLDDVPAKAADAVEQQELCEGVHNVTALLPSSDLTRVINFGDPYSIPGNIAGGTGRWLTRPDSRTIEGQVIVRRTGPTTISVESRLKVVIKDAIDFEPGDLGASIERIFTVPLDFLENNGRVYGVPFTASFTDKPGRSVTRQCDCKKPGPPPPPECGTYQTLNRQTCEYETNYVPCVRQPKDPNDILGPDGYGEQRWIAADQKVPYTIRFENAPTATAPAQVVRVTQTLDDDPNPSSFRLGNFGFGGLTFEVPANRAFYTTRLDLTATRGYFVDVAAGIDVATREAFWEVATVDPLTGEAPLDAAAGFLPVNDAAGAGEGFVSYSVRARATAATGARVDAQARIVFDTEGPIDTPPIFNTLDADAPASAAAPSRRPPTPRSRSPGAGRTRTTGPGWPSTPCTCPRTAGSSSRGSRTPP